MDKSKAGSAGASTTPKVGGAFAGAMSQFSQTVNKGTAFGASAAVSVVNTKHKNTIVNIQLQQEANGGNVTRFTTAGIDGRVCVWNVASMSLP